MIFNEYTPESNRYFLNPDECYKSANSYKDVVEFLKQLKSFDEDNSFSLEENVLVIETNDGVFIRSKQEELCMSITSLVENPDDLFPKFEIITEKQWNDITTRYKEPIDSFGDLSLARWRVGF
jgi:hypothetical protein